MGLLKRFRASSSASNRAPLDNADFTAPPMPPPPILTHSNMYASVSRASVADSMTPSTSTSGMETPKSSRSFWKRKAKGKDKEGFGLPYESTSPSPAPAPPLPHSQSQYQGERSRNSSFVHVPAPRRELSQEGYRGREGSSTPKQELTPTGARTQPAQRAMLGKLDFEGQGGQGQGQGFNHTPEVYSRQGTRTSSIPFGTSQQPQPNSRPVTAIYLERPQPQAPTPTADPAGRMSQEEIEHLTSPEKQPANTPNTRRMSIQEEPGSPTPRKTTLPPQELALKPKPSRTSSVDNYNALSSRRPSANRRNSFIPLNPFRSRGSMNDLDQPVEDDGSFQVMSFRHVSGASDYQDPAPRAEVETSPVNTYTQTPQPTSRPMSRAASLASLDDHISTAAKVSAGAFRKGVRRPSSTYIDNMDNDEDDDVPLGMLRHSGRENSSVSLSSFKEGARAPIQMRSPGRKPGQSVPTTPSRSRPSLPSSPKAPVEEKVISHTRSKTMPLISPNELHPNFPSPSHSPVGSPKASTRPELSDSGYFGAVTTTNTRRTPPPVADSPEFDFASLDYPVSAFSTSPQATKSTPLAHRDLDALVTKTTGLAVSIPSPAGGSTLSSAISPAPVKQRQEADKLDEDLIIRSMAVYGEDIENEPPTPKVAIRQQSQSSLYNESMASDNSTIRSPLSERLGNLVGPRPMGKPSLVGLNTNKVDDGGIKSPGSDATVSPVIAQTPRSSFARVTSQLLKDESDSEGTATSEDEMPPPPPPTRPVNVPRSSFANAPPRPVSSFKATRSQSSLSQAIKPNDDSDSEEDMPLARIKSKASRSSLAVAQSGMRPATIHSESPKPAKMSPPMSTSPASFARRASVPNAVVPPTEHVMGQKLWDASPASSQSGLTGDSSSVQPITPSDREMGGKISRDGSFPPTPMYHAPTRPELAERPPSVMSAASNMDDATRQRMKEMWQAQYMAAAHKAFEEEWERQSNVSGSVAPSVQSYSPYTPQPHPQPQQYPMPMPMGYNYPPQFQMYPPHIGHHQQMPWAPPPDHGQSMYAYGPATQSVYGGEFGPPSNGMQSPYRPMSMMGGFPASYSTTNLHQYSPQQMPTSQSSYFQSPPPQHQYTRSSSSNDLTPPKKGLINQIPSNSPKGVNNRRSQLGISVINADDRERERSEHNKERAGQAQPPTSWRRSTTVPVMDREDHSAPRRKRQSSYLVN